MAGNRETNDTDVPTSFQSLHKDEKDSILHRRSSIYDGKPGPNGLWGLALSGGGIRSATFCLGVLQALAKAKFDVPKEPVASGSNPLLARFDFLSTVSGGGYVGSFYSAIFRKRPMDIRNEQARATAAYDALAADPPGRMGGKSASIAGRPLRWLRENSRYLAPNNTGDLILDIAIAIRNLCAIHYVIGISLLTIFMCMFAFRYGTAIAPNWLGKFASGIELLTQPKNIVSPGAIWWSPWFVLAGFWTIIGLIPLGVAYWIDQDKPTTWYARIFTPFVVATALLVVAICLLFTNEVTFEKILESPISNGTAFSVMIFGAVLSVALIEFVFAKILYGDSVSVFRAKITRALSFALIVTIVLAIVAVVETAGQTLYLWLRTSDNSPVTVITLAATVAALIAVLRKFAPLLAQPDKTGWLAKLPLNVILGAIGVPCLFLTVVIWHCAATAIFFSGALPTPTPNTTIIATAFDLAVLHRISFFELILYYPWAVIAFLVAATIASGVFLGFVNLSSLQTMYSARITRAYLGASNDERFSGKSVELDVTEPQKDDDFSRTDYYNTDHLGPAHIINVTINATTGSGDQLTQRDRQGIPMAITPAGITVNGSVHSKGKELTIGQWIGISGAAFSTGIGRGTGLGTALVFGLANIRLGSWWDSGQTSRYYVWPLWRNQVYLNREFRARFVGTDDSHWYLSDGGHYENTGVLELLRRRVNFIVCCDCGADPKYEFSDLANLIRISRIDFGAEFTLIPPLMCDVLAPRATTLTSYFADDESEICAARQGGDNKCALLYRVNYADDDAISYLVVLKPRLIQDAPLDLFEYRSRNLDFPQQTTFDQFFDEAQWEGYRKLGLEIGRKLFP